MRRWLSGGWSRWQRWKRRHHGITDKPLPPHEAIHQLGTEARSKAVPKEFYISERSEKGHSGTFVGRNTTMQDIETFMQQNSSGSSPAFAMLLTNAPGSGKSTVLDEFRFRWARDGCPVIQIGADAFLSRPEFVDQLQSTDLWRREPSPEMRRWAKFQAAGLLTWILYQGSRAFATLKQVPPPPDASLRRWMEVANELHEMTKAKPPSTPEDALVAIDQACRKGFVIAVDECSGWQGHGDSAVAKGLLNLVADATRRRGAGVQGAGLLLAGLSDAQVVTDQLTLSRAKIVHLEPLSREECAELIRTELRAAGAPPSIEERWTATLSRDFGMWTQHSRRAASVASEMIKRTYSAGLTAAEREATWDQRLQWVREQTGRQIVHLYAHIVGRASDQIGPRAVRALAAAHQRTLGQIPDLEFHAIVQDGLARHPKRTQRHPDTDSAIQVLMHIGLVHQALGVTPENRAISWSIPMGSLTSYIEACAEDDEPPDETGERKGHDGAVPEPVMEPSPTMPMQTRLEASSVGSESTAAEAAIEEPGEARQLEAGTGQKG